MFFRILAILVRFLLLLLHQNNNFNSQGLVKELGNLLPDLFGSQWIMVPFYDLEFLVTRILLIQLLRMLHRYYPISFCMNEHRWTVSFDDMLDRLKFIYAEPSFLFNSVAYKVHCDIGHKSWYGCFLSSQILDQGWQRTKWTVQHHSSYSRIWISIQKSSDSTHDSSS